MPAFNHKKTGKPAIMCSSIKVLKSSIKVKCFEELPNWEYNEVIIPPEMISGESMENLYHYFKAFNGLGKDLYLTRFPSGFPDLK